MSGLDEEPRVIRRLGLDHDDPHIAIGVQSAGESKVERALFDLLIGRERYPLPVLESEPKARDRTLERHPTEYHSHRGARYGDDVEWVHVVDRQDRRDHLDLVTKGLREGRPKRAVGETSGEDGRLRCSS